MKEVRHVHIEDLRIPIELIPEKRRSARAAFGKKAILLRVPKRSTDHEIEHHFQWVVDWLNGLFTRKPKVFERYRPVQYYTGKIISTTYKDYQLQIEKKNRKTLGGTLNENKLQLSVPSETETPLTSIGNLISRVIAKDQIPWIEAKVHSLNEEHFEERIKKISLRHSRTRWGSCNHNGNISLSTRILLAPEQIIDHIIIHELAHLKEMNHSPKFWAWVKNAEPDHDKNDQWLKVNGYKLKF